MKVKILEEDNIYDLEKEINEIARKTKEYSKKIKDIKYGVANIDDCFYYSAMIIFED